MYTRQKHKNENNTWNISFQATCIIHKKTIFTLTSTFAIVKGKNLVFWKNRESLMNFEPLNFFKSTRRCCRVSKSLCWSLSAFSRLGLWIIEGMTTEPWRVHKHSITVRLSNLASSLEFHWRESLVGIGNQANMHENKRHLMDDKCGMRMSSGKQKDTEHGMKINFEAEKLN